MRSIRVGVAGCWVVLFACGGVAERHSDEHGSGGTSSTGSSKSNGSAGSPASAGGTSTMSGSASTAAGSASTMAGSATTVAGSATTVAGSATTVGGSASAVAGSTSMPVGGATTTPDPGGEPAPCFNDTDCPGNVCGGQVCNWTLAHPKPVGEKVFVCNAAGLQPPGRDGWCTTDQNCKCLSAGAKCIAPYCSFTRP